MNDANINVFDFDYMKYSKIIRDIDDASDKSVNVIDEQKINFLLKTDLKSQMTTSYTKCNDNDNDNYKLKDKQYGYDGITLVEKCCPLDLNIKVKSTNGEIDNTDKEKPYEIDIIDTSFLNIVENYDYKLPNFTLSIKEKLILNIVKLKNKKKYLMIIYIV